jgi:hypothetical protein
MVWRAQCSVRSTRIFCGSLTPQAHLIEKKMSPRVSDTQLFHLQNRRSCWTKHALRVLMAEEFQKKSPLDGRESIRRVEFESLDSE